MKLYAPGAVPDVARDTEERLKAIDPDFMIKMIKTPNLVSGANESWGESASSELVDRIAVCVRWAQNDPRRAHRDPSYVKEHGYDLLCVMPADITIDQVPAFLENSLRRSRAPKQIMDEVVKWNEDQKLRNGSAIFEYSAEVIDRVAQARRQGKDTAAVPDPLSD